jgi:hypothetical protein
MQTKGTIANYTVGVDLGDRKSAICRLDADGELEERRMISTTREFWSGWRGRGGRIRSCSGLSSIGGAGAGGPGAAGDAGLPGEVSHAADQPRARIGEAAGGADPEVLGGELSPDGAGAHSRGTGRGAEGDDGRERG